MGNSEDNGEATGQVNGQTKDKVTDEANPLDDEEDAFAFPDYGDEDEND